MGRLVRQDETVALADVYVENCKYRVNLHTIMVTPVLICLFFPYMLDLNRLRSLKKFIKSPAYSCAIKMPNQYPLT